MRQRKRCLDAKARVELVDEVRMEQHRRGARRQIRVEGRARGRVGAAGCWVEGYVGIGGAVVAQQMLEGAAQLDARLPLQQRYARADAGLELVEFEPLIRSESGAVGELPKAVRHGLPEMLCFQTQVDRRLAVRKRHPHLIGETA